MNRRTRSGVFKWKLYWHVPGYGKRYPIQKPVETFEPLMSIDIITNCFRRAIDQTVAGFGDWCVTLTSSRDQTRWIQVTWEHLNLAFPEDIDLDGAIRVFPTVPDLEMIDVQPGSHLTFAHGADFSLPDISAFVLKYSEVVMNEKIDESWIMTEEQL